MKVHAVHARIQEYLLSNPLDGVEIVANPKGANYIISGRFGETDYHKDLRGIIIPWTGHNRIDLDAMRNHDLELYVTPTRSRYVAEKAVTLTLALLGRTIPYHLQLQQGNWSDRNSDKRIPWVSIQSCTIGLLGFGRIGSLIYQFLQGFASDIMTVKRNRIYPKGLKLVDSLEDLVEKSDVIIVSIPLNKETEDLFDESLLRTMTNKYLVNVGRGKVVNEADLYHALTTRTLAGYASDVWYQYPKGKEMQYPSSYPMYDLPNVVLSNHSGGYTTHTNDEVNRDLLQQLTRLNNGDTSDKLDLSNLI